MSTLIDYVNARLNAGDTVVVVPLALVDNSTDDEKVEARRLCVLNGAKLKVE